MATEQNLDRISQELDQARVSRFAASVKEDIQVFSMLLTPILLALILWRVW
jgi:hypothetical protein